MLRVPATDPGADSIETHLADCFGTEVRVGVLLGTRRVNQKPVLQVFDLDGRILGYAKVGHNDLTAALVRREAEALATVGARTNRRRSGSQRSCTTASGQDSRSSCSRRCGPTRGTRVSPAARLAAMREVARLTGSGEAPWPAAASGRGCGPTPSGWPSSRTAARLVAAADALERSHGADQVELGALARRLGPLEHGHGRRRPAGLGLGALRRRGPGRLRRPPLRGPERPPGRTRGGPSGRGSSCSR